MSATPGERGIVNDGSGQNSIVVSETAHPYYEEVILRAQGDIALIKGEKDPLLVLSFKTAENPNPQVSSRGRRLFIVAPLVSNILLRRGEIDTWIGYTTALGPIGETSVIFNQSHPLYLIGDSIRLHFLGKDEDGATVGIESSKQLAVENAPWNLNSKELLRASRLSKK